MKKLLSIFAALALIACFIFALPACNKNEVKLLEENLVDDAYDNYYEIFVYSFYDSDGDGYGDLNGVTQKLDYIRDLGYTGIWLMPIMPSPSYHGYDVTDYFDINPKYGTLEDYDNLLDAAHERGIKVIIDLVINHTSSQHPWFVSSANYINGRGGSAVYQTYYNWSNETKAGYNQNGNYYYESRFDSGMPDLNLDNDNVRDELEKVIKFWLEKGTDGFRLDACTSYYTEDGQASVDFCTWIKETSSKYNEDAYIVGEVWSGKSTIESYYTSGVDSFFCFPASTASGASGYVPAAVLTGNASSYWTSVNNVLSMAGDYIPAPFLCNHDVGRIAGTMAREEDMVKFAYGLVCMYNGNVFAYYGDEIGMLGSASDPDKRIGMKWDNNFTALTNVPPGATQNEYVFDGVAEQLKDPNSILNYYKLCNNARNAFPAIMRGTPERIAYEDTSVLVFKKTWKDETVTIVINFAEETKKVSGIQGELAQSLCATGSIKSSKGTLTMPKYAIAILK